MINTFQFRNINLTTDDRRRMKISLILIGFIFVSCSAFSQKESFPNGVYLNIEQLKNKKPAYDLNLTIVKRSDSDISWNGGNDYKLQSSVDSISKKLLKRKIYAYIKNDSLFLNCIPHKLGTLYTLAIIKGTFIIFKGAMSNKEASEKAATFGFLFGPIGGGIAVATIAKKRFLYSLSLRTGNAKRLTKEYMSERLKEIPTVLEKFLTEEEQDSDTTLIKYADLLNQYIPVKIQ